jgi:hypothetical protein
MFVMGNHFMPSRAFWSSDKQCLGTTITPPHTMPAPSRDIIEDCRVQEIDLVDLTGVSASRVKALWAGSGRPGRPRRSTSCRRTI